MYKHAIYLKIIIAATFFVCTVGLGTKKLVGNVSYLEPGSSVEIQPERNVGFRHSSLQVSKQLAFVQDVISCYMR